MMLCQSFVERAKTQNSAMYPCNPESNTSAHQAGNAGLFSKPGAVISCMTFVETMGGNTADAIQYPAAPIAFGVRGCPNGKFLPSLWL